MQNSNLDYNLQNNAHTLFNMREPRSIAEWMVWYRAKHNLSLREAGELCGVGHTYVARIESGKLREPITFLQGLKKHLGKADFEALVLAQSHQFIDKLNET